MNACIGSLASREELFVFDNRVLRSTGFWHSRRSEIGVLCVTWFCPGWLAVMIQGLATSQPVSGVSDVR